ncbi:membrane protein [Streptomyces griseoflavus Tu4000]|uniref:Membrane protein n=1 Tax=Streptomyces griseoflavus Tu4000 TaxID=467200 RepID=D9XRT9_9ACTN|nr:membrane protein [Streptomyces griseoflavus Tu4000]
MRPDDHRAQGRAGGIPDGLLIGILAFLLGMTTMVWTATGLASLFAHGHWPSGVAFTRTPLAMRHLASDPHDLPGAWPETPQGALSGYGLFWGLLIGQLMILVVLTVFVLGTVARWRAVRARRREARPADAPKPRPEPQHERHPEPEPKQLHEVPTPRAPEEETPERQEPVAAHPSGTGQPGGWEAPRAEAAGLHYGPPATRRTTAAQAVRERGGRRPGQQTKNPALWHETRTPGPSWAPPTSTTPRTSATPRPASTGRRQPAARTRTRPRPGRPHCSPPSAPPPASTRRSATPPRHCSAATSTPPPSTAVPSATSTAGPRASRCTTPYASSAPAPRPPPAPPANSRRPSRRTPNAGTWPSS